MAEAFLEEIYQDAMVIELLQEYLENYEKGCLSAARRSYNMAAIGLERIVRKLSSTNPDEAIALQDVALSIKERFEDPCHANGLILGQLLPRIFSYISNFTGIEVEEGQYVLRSCDSAFLTIIDNSITMTLHNIHDPMWEAHRIAESLYDPRMEKFIVLGCGMAYLPYQLWRISGGAMEIIIYEEDNDILAYAKRYGVLSWIPEQNLKIVMSEDTDFLAMNFLEKIHLEASTDNISGYYIMPWKRKKYEAFCNGEIAILKANYDLARETKNSFIINKWKNDKRDCVTFRWVREKYNKEEWAVVSAGPSLNDSMDFLKRAKGRIGIIGVNTVLRRLAQENILPDVVVAADQDESLLKHIEGIEDVTSEIPLLASRTLSWRFVEQYKGPVTFITANPDGRAIDSGEKDEEIWKIGGTVSCMALEAAIRMGAKKIYLIGQDLAYPGRVHYADGMPHDKKLEGVELLETRSTDGGIVETSRTFLWFLAAIESEVAAHPEVEVYNLSEHGALIRGTKKYTEQD